MIHLGHVSGAGFVLQSRCGGGKIHHAALQSGMGKAQVAHRLVYRRHAYSFDESIRGGVVAEGDHQNAQIADVQRQGRVQLF